MGAGRSRSLARKITAGLAESNGSLPPGGWLEVTCRLTACIPGSVPARAACRVRPVQLADLSADFSSRECPLGMRACTRVRVLYMINKKHLKNVGHIRHCEPPHALILHCHSPGVAIVARRHCRTQPAHRCARQRQQRQRVTEGDAMAP